MRRAIASGLLLLALGAGWFASVPLSYADDNTPADPPLPRVAPAAPVRTITVKGTGEASARPDQAIVGLGTETQAPTAREAQAQNAAKTNGVIDALKAAGIPPETIQTTGIGLFPVREQRPPRPGQSTSTESVIVGYRASASLRVKVPNVDQTGPVIDAAVQAGADEVQGIRFTLQDPSALRAEALRLAVQDARQWADALAGAAGVTITGVEAIVESGATLPPQPVSIGAGAAPAAANAPTPVEPGQLTVHASVSVTFSY